MAWKGTVTNIGSELLAQWMEGSVLTVTGAKTGAGVVPEDELVEQTDVMQETQQVSVISSKVVETGRKFKIEIPAYTENYMLKQVGLYAKLQGSSDEPILLAIFQNVEGVPIPDERISPDFMFTFYATVVMSNTGQLTITIDPSVLVTQADLQAAIAQLSARAYRKSIGDGRRTYTITHKLGTEGIICQLWKKNGEVPFYKVWIENENTIQIDFEEPVNNEEVDVVISAIDRAVEVLTVDWENITNIPTMNTDEMSDILNREEN